MPPESICKPGLVYFWFLNDACDEAQADRFIDAFAAAETGAVVLHPRPGLLLPYGSDAWFDFVRRAVERCADRGLPVWLYDEDPYPSGAGGGRLVSENPAYEARAIERFVREPGDDDLFCFPAGRLLWCGAVSEADGEVIDLTSQVGMVRRDWKLLDPWDSRWYYPNTPLYDCPRSDAYNPEFAVRVPEIPQGYRMQAFVARPSGGDIVWGHLPDTLNPEVTQAFVRDTYERYRDSVGEHFGKTVTAVFTDEPKFFGHYPWTEGLFNAFTEQFGYDLRPRLWSLYSESDDEDAVLARLHYRQWCGTRFREAWLAPVSDWCRKHDLALVGHISPEDDPVEQVAAVGNLFPCFHYFDLPGIDLIVPAAGDDRHPLLNIGVISAASHAQQNDKPGVMSESLGCCGNDATVEQAARILRRQSMMGVGAPVVHGAFNSVEGFRLQDAPPEWGPDSEHWDGMTDLGRELAGVQPVICDARQIAPVAILWPIRSFSAIPFAGFSQDSPMRNALMNLIHRCLERQVGVHLVDENDLCAAETGNGRIKLGRAEYTHLLVPDCVVLDVSTVQALRCAAEAGVDVVLAGSPPRWIEQEDALGPANLDFCRAAMADEVVDALPRLAEIGPDRTNIRCTAWEKKGRVTLLVMNLDDSDRTVSIDGEERELAAGELVVLSP